MNLSVLDSSPCVGTLESSNATNGKKPIEINSNGVQFSKRRRVSSLEYVNSHQAFDPAKEEVHLGHDDARGNHDRPKS